MVGKRPRGILALSLISIAAGCGPNSAPPGKPAETPGDKRSAEAIAKDWTFGPGTEKPQSYGTFVEKSADNLVVITGRLRDPKKAKDWMAKASAFYAEKCGSDKDPVKLHAETGKHQVGLNGESKTKGRWLITEPGLMSIPIADIPPRPVELLFVYTDAEATVTTILRQEGDDVVTFSIAATTR